MEIKYENTAPVWWNSDDALPGHVLGSVMRHGRKGDLLYIRGGWYFARDGAISPLPTEEVERPLFRSLLQRGGWTQERVAELAGVTTGAVEHWLSGRRRVPLYAFLLLGRKL